MAGSKSKRTEPSYKSGKLRDKKLHKLRDATFQPQRLHEIIKKAVTKKS